jgi:hypothetical protein
VDAPRDERLSAMTPVVNYVTVRRLIGLAEVEGVFDPYLDDRGLQVLMNVFHFGAMVSPRLRLLTASPETVSRYLLGWWLTNIRATEGELRVMAKVKDPSGKVVKKTNQHRRYLLLSDRRSVCLGNSFNQFHKKEFVYMSDDEDGKDRAHFERVWAKSAPVPLVP